MKIMLLLSPYLRIFLLVFMSLTISGICSLSTVKTTTTSNQNQCNWNYNGSTALCNIRLLEQTPLNLQGAQGSSNLHIKCNEEYLFESQLPIGKSFHNLQTLNELYIEKCKLLQLAENIFINLTTLKILHINTKNSDWSPDKSLELNKNSLNGLKQLTELDLSDNNIRQLPNEFLCPIGNLQILNLTNNHLKQAENIGFYDMSCNGGSELQILDLSYNEIIKIPDNWGIKKLRRLQHLNLQFNNITELSGEILTGLSSLRIINLSNNHLELLPDGLFIGTKELREIHLQNNQLYQLPRGLLHRLEQLLILDLSNNQLTSHYIDNTTFSGLIRLIILNLSNNAITRIDNKTFKGLYFLQILNLKNNSIGYIENDAFLSLYNLHTLNLAENRLHTINNKLFNGLYILTKLTLNNNLINFIELNSFKNCSDLKELDLSSNQLLDIPLAIQDLTMLRTLDLGENQIKTFNNNIFNNLNQLTGLRLIDNQIGNITKDMFINLPRLSVLNLAKNRIQNIERGTFDKNFELEAIRLDRNYLTDINGVFATLTSLLWLNLSENHLIWFDYAFIPSNLKWLDIHGNFIEILDNYYKLQNEINLKTLDASHNRITEIGPLSIPNTIELLFINNNLVTQIHINTFIDKLNLARVDLYANLLNKLQLNTIRLTTIPFNKTIPGFYLGDNPFDCDCSMEWLQRINNITTRQYPRIMDIPNIDCKISNKRGLIIKKLINLNINDFLCKYQTHCFALCHCCDFDACDCEMTCPNNCTCYHDQTWSTNIVDCGKQMSIVLPKNVPMDSTILYLDGNNFPELQNHAFIGRKLLKTLYINSSNIINIHNRTFSGLISLEKLYLNNNHIELLHGYEFEQLSNLKELYLQNNYIKKINNSTFIALQSLELLRIDHNYLIAISILQLKIPPLINIKLLWLGENQWSCRCHFLNELTAYIADNALIIQDLQDIYCIENKKRYDLDLNTTSICNEYYTNGSLLENNNLTKSYLPLLVISLILIFLLVILVIIVIFRETFRLWLFKNYGLRIFGHNCDNTEKLYDAIILYSAKDSDNIVYNIVNELETGQPILRICLQHRDLSHDAKYIQIFEAAKSSKRIIIVLTRNFLQTEWINYDLRKSVHDSLFNRLNKLIIIEVENDVKFETDNDIELLSYLKISTVNRINHNDHHFWNKLKYLLPYEYQYHSNNYTIDNNHEHIKQQSSPGIMFRQAPPPPPAYCADIDDNNYSSATTATPSPRPNRRSNNNNELQHYNNRPPSEHIYSSIDSDYSTLDNENMMIQRNQQQQQQVIQQTWRPTPARRQDVGGQHTQAYLV